MIESFNSSPVTSTSGKARKRLVYGLFLFAGGVAYKKAFARDNSTNAFAFYQNVTVLGSLVNDENVAVAFLK